MIYKLMSGRLGNQMFQYAAVRAFQLKYRPSDDILLDFSLVEKQGEKKDGFKNQLIGFNLPQNVYFTDNSKVDLKIKIIFLFYKFICFIIKITSKKNKYTEKRNRLEKKISPILQKMGIYIYTDGYIEFKNCNKKDTFFWGFFESSKFFNDIKEILKEEFVSNKEVKSTLLKKIQNSSDSVCVSVRAGDFLSKKFKKDYYVCTPKYFEEAIKEMQAKLKSPTFFVFSDDIEWCKEKINFPLNVVFEEEKLNVYEKLTIMSKCKNFILSNSSFSYWASFLADDDDKKIIIAPNRWSNNLQNPDIYEKKWTILNVD